MLFGAGTAAAAPCDRLLTGKTVQQALEDVATHRNHAVYAWHMDKSLPEKLSKITPWLPSQKRLKIFDIGTGTGSVASALAESFPDSLVTGIDLSSEMIELARKQPRRVNLRFRQAEAGTSFASEADVAIYSSLLHEVYSYNGDSMNAVAAALRTAYSSLKPGGRVIVRDFIRPEDGHRQVRLTHRKADVPEGSSSFADFARQFGRAVPMRVVRETNSSVVYETDLQSAYEYIYRKDYRNNWKAELRERYGFWNESEARSLLTAAGFSVLHFERLNNPWIVTNRLTGKVKLQDVESGRILPYPDYQLLIVGVK